MPYIGNLESCSFPMIALFGSVQDSQTGKVWPPLALPVLQRPNEPGELLAVTDEMKHKESITDEVLISI